jgi:DNA-binding LacI/PurR family transcriptional regulator
MITFMTTKTGQPDTKVEELYKRLRALALEKGPGAQLPTVRVLCESLATTRVTLREALTLLEAEQIIYTKDRQGIFVSPNIYHKSVHILFSSQSFAAPASPFWSMLWMQLEQEAQLRTTFKNEICTFHLVKPTDDPDYSIPESIETLLQTERVDGVLAIGLQSSGEGVLNGGNLPCVTFAGEGACTVYLDSFGFARLATEALIRLNCRRMGWWAYNIASHPLERMSSVHAFRQLLEEYRRPLYPELIRIPRLPPSQTSLSLQEQGYLLAREVFEGPASARPDGLVISDDMITDGALAAFDELGIRVGYDIQVVTHANVGSPILFGRTKHMAVVEYDPALLAQAMFSALDMLIAGQKPAEQIVKIRPRLRQ